jgi:hypothetical protein
MSTIARRPRPKLLAALAVALAASPAAALDPPALRCGTGVHAGEADGFVALPNGGVFCPLLADPKAMRTFVSYQRGEFPEVTGATASRTRSSRWWPTAAPRCASAPCAEPASSRRST